MCVCVRICLRSVCALLSLITTCQMCVGFYTLLLHRCSQQCVQRQVSRERRSGCRAVASQARRWRSSWQRGFKEQGQLTGTCNGRAHAGFWQMLVKHSQAVDLLALSLLEVLKRVNDLLFDFLKSNLSAGELHFARVCRRGSPVILKRSALSLKLLRRMNDSCSCHLLQKPAGNPIKLSSCYSSLWHHVSCQGLLISVCTCACACACAGGRTGKRARARACVRGWVGGWV